MASPDASSAPDAPSTRESLRLCERMIAEYVWRPDLPTALAPRPFLHPVRTLAGTVVTELMPASHRHHLGLSIAVPEVDDANFWGSRTFLPGHGPAWLDNQGTQEHVRWLRRSPTHLAHTLSWKTIDDRVLLAERRTISCRLLNDAWALDIEFTLTNATGHRVTIRSPASHGRIGAGYGGFFWRAPTGASPVRVFAPSGEGVEAVHATRSPWIAVTCHSDHGRPWTLTFAGGDPRTRDDQWFVRTRDYIGIGSALAWDQPLVLAEGEPVTRRVVTVISDGSLTVQQAARLAAGSVS